MGAATLLLLAVRALPAAFVPGIGPAADTVLRVGAGDRLSVTDLDADVTVVVWQRDELRVSDADDPGERVRLVRRNGRIGIDGSRRHRNLLFEAPAWLPLELGGPDVSVRIEGPAEEVEVRTGEGTVDLAGVSGVVDVHTVDGEIRARDVAGRVRLRSGDEDIHVQGARGRLVVSTTDGDVTLERMDVDELEASTTDGDVRFSGVFRPGGSYALSTHDGDVVAEVPDDAHVEVEVSTFSGTFEASFPVTLDRIRSGRRVSFTLGRGGARLVLEAFDGDVVLRRLGEGGGAARAEPPGVGSRTNRERKGR